MESTLGEVTLFDLLAWDSRMQVVSTRAEPLGDRDLLDRVVDWVVTARSTPPMLPHLRGGELIILPQRIAAETGIPFPQLVNEIAMQPIAGVLTDSPATVPAQTAVTVLRIARIDAETESDLNRMLTNRRRETLQIAADVEHRINDLSARNARPGELIDELSRLLRTPITITTPSGSVSFTTGNSRDIPDANSSAWIGRPFLRGQHLWIGPIAPEGHALIRATIDRVGSGIQRALTAASAQAAPVPDRGAALQALLFENDEASPGHQLELAYQAGIRPGHNLRVALYPVGTITSAMHRALRPLGDVISAGTINGTHVAILMESAGHFGYARYEGSNGQAWAAISSPVDGAHALPQAMREARYVAALLTAGLLPGGTVRFDDPAALGAFQLLFELWETPLLERYRDVHIGALARADNRGILLDTLRVLLEEGGSQRQAAEKLAIHRNTLGYRLRQIRQVLPVDLDAPNVRLTLHLALIAHTLIERG